MEAAEAKKEVDEEGKEVEKKEGCFPTPPQGGFMTLLSCCLPVALQRSACGRWEARNLWACPSLGRVLRMH